MSTFFTVRQYGNITSAFLAAKGLFDAEVDAGNEGVELAPVVHTHGYRVGFVVTTPEPVLDLRALGISYPLSGRRDYYELS